MSNRVCAQGPPALGTTQDKRKPNTSSERPQHNRPQRGQGTRAQPRGGTSPLGTANPTKGGTSPLVPRPESERPIAPSATATRERFARRETRGGPGEHEGGCRMEIRTCEHECNLRGLKTRYRVMRSMQRQCIADAYCRFFWG